MTVPVSEPMNASAGLITRRAGQGPARPVRESQGGGRRPGACRPNPYVPRGADMGSINRRPRIVLGRPGRPRIEAEAED